MTQGRNVISFDINIIIYQMKENFKKRLRLQMIYDTFCLIIIYISEWCSQFNHWLTR